MKKYLLIIVLLIYSTIAMNAQTSNYGQKRGFDPNKLSFGGNLGIGFGSNNYFGFSANPQVGYNFTNKFVSGLGLSYSYSKENGNFWGDAKWKYSRNYVGVNLFANYYPISKLVLTARPEIIRMWQNYTNTDSNGSYRHSSNDIVPTVVVGAGVRLHPVLLTLNYDLVQNDNSPYGSSVFLGIGVMF